MTTATDSRAKLLSGKRVLITGCTLGIGREATLQLAALGADLVLIARDPAKLTALAAELNTLGGGGTVSTEVADLSSQQAIRALAERLLANNPRIDVLINNAGGIFLEHKKTVDHIEWTFAVNHLAYFLLTELLLPRIIESAPARIISTSSGAHVPGRIDFENLNGEKGYGGMRAYAQSKLANLLFTYELARRLEGKGVTANALHPGAVRTGFGRNEKGWLSVLVKLGAPFLLSPKKAARTITYLASSPEVADKSGGYYIKSRPRKSSKRSYDEVAAKLLWEISEKMTGLSQKLLSAGGE